MPTITVYHNEIPPSSNTNTGVGGRGKPQAIARTKGTWEGIFGFLILGAGMPKRCHRVTVKVQLEFRTNQRRDSDNFYFPIAKPLGDALTKGGWLEDDDATRYRCERPEIVLGATDLPARVKGRTTLEITYDTQPPPMVPA